MNLETARLTLRPLAVTDAARLHAMISDPETMRFWDVVAIADFEMTTEILASQLFEVASGTALYWAIEHTADQTFIGTCDISEINHHHRRADVGFLLVRPYWGTGYAFEAMQAVIAHAKAHLNLQRISARTHVGNTRSIRLLRKLGFHQEGILRGYVERDNERHDCPIFGLLL
jgi:[ribosomal protein S5]-alanine N-acetyltransferase